MKRTISIRLETCSLQGQKFYDLQDAYCKACNLIVPAVIENRCWNRFSLHHLVYSHVRQNSLLGSQMVCNAIFSVCKAYRAKAILPNEEVPLIEFHQNRSTHFDIHIPIQELVFDGVGYSSNSPSASRSVSMNTEARRRWKI